MRQRESSLWAWLKRHLSPLPKLHIQRVENGVGNGTPDVEGYEGALDFSFWWELKVGEFRERSQTVYVKFQPLQIPWLKKRWNMGGSAWTVIKTSVGVFLLPGNKLDIFQNNKGIAPLSYLIEHSVVPTDAAPQAILLASCRKMKC